MKAKPIQAVRMIDFISDLYSRFKVLNRLSEKQSLDFQRQVVTLLVDPNQNVNTETFSSLIQPQGVQSFVLEMLSKIINRSPFKNQFELNRNLAAITENIKKEQEEIQKRQKVLERKEERLKSVQQGLLASIKQKMQSFQNQAILKITKKENEVKKNITQLLSQLKAKEKLVLEKYEQSKNNARLLLQVGQKEKIINDKLKLIEKKEKQLKNKDNQCQQVKRQSEMQQSKQQIERLRESLKQATKRYKNLQLAYKKLKNEKTKSESSQKPEPTSKKPIKNNVIDLDQLQLSGIHQAQPNNNEQFINYIHLEQANGKLQSLKNVLTNPQSKDDALKLKQVKQLLNIRQEIIQLSQSQSEEDEGQEARQDYMPSCLEPISDEPPTTNDIIVKLKDIDLEQEKAKLKFINDGILLNYIEHCYKMNTPHQFCEVLLEKILQLIEESSCYMEIIAFLATEKLVKFLQLVYLSHETIADIIETVTLILSRIKLKDFQLQLSQKFIKALQIRLKVQSKGSFLYGNVHFILN